MALGITQAFLEKGFKVIVIGRNNEKLNKFKENLESILINKAKYSFEKVEEILNGLELELELEKVAKTKIVIEAIIEDLKIKQTLFEKLDRVCGKKTILASNTSSLSITEIGNRTLRNNKIIGLHFFNPVPKMNLVEIIKGLGTNEETIKETQEIIKKINKEYIIIEEIPGFIVNRILIPMINEAIILYENKIAKKEDIDKAMILGAGHPMGPLALADMIGNDIVLKIMDTLYDETKDSKYRASYLLRKYVKGNRLGRKTKRGFYEY